ncbi:WD40/YVTN/BNR-like repeat-containing protein [Polaribacter sp. IC073]|uniref:WD40/YVTN/BNR-like repeat-containing protein n=1 Tax=Polaribacter sp. IC073 TaxID=2508540 RepID=UPI0011BF56CB|nr:oxidoreductase [Polaribacter sp. IC073]TXD49318.1 oxidoreductase [Polaribacter sp. IC073]
MKRIIVLIFTFLFLIACKQEYKPRIIEQVSIKAFKMDSSSIRAIQVVDSETIFYAGSNGDVGYTTDNGTLWNALNIRYQDSIIPHFRSLGFNGSDYFALSIGNPALLYKISEGEATLQYVEEDDNVFYDALTFFDDNLHGIAVGDPTENCASIIVTEDGGENWNKIPCDNLPEINKGEAFFAASNTNIKTIGSTVWIASGGNNARILKSTNYGKTWQVFETPIIQGNGPQGIYSIDFFNENTGIIVGGDYSKPLENKANKAITADGGKTWTLVSDNQKPNYKSCVQYVPNTFGKEVFAVGKTGVSFSNDGGLTWTEVSKESYYAIQFIDENTAWLSGHQKIGKLEL